MPVMDGIYRVADRSGMTTMAEKGEPQVRFVDSGNRGPLIFFEPRLLHRRFHRTSFEVLPTAPPGFARRRSFLEPAERLRVTMALETMFPQAGAPSALLPQPRRPPSFSRLHGNNSRCMFCEIAFGRRRFLEQLPARRVGDGPMAPHHRPATPARCVSLIPYRAGLFGTALPFTEWEPSWRRCRGGSDAGDWRKLREVLLPV